MSQTGADSMAKQGKNCDEIIHHFYKDVEIKDINMLDWVQKNNEKILEN